MELALVTVAPDGVVASMIEALLKDAGIAVLLRGTESSGWLFPGGPAGLGAVQILVPEDRLAEARQLLPEQAAS
jgi:hypothetical protein